MSLADALPRSASLAWWLTAWLRGHVVTDLAIEGAGGPDGLHLVTGPDGGGQLVDLFAQARRSGATAAGLALPVEGDPLGLGGPRELNDAALEAGEAVVLADAGLGAVPDEGAEVVDVALLDEGGAVSASEVRRRREALQPLERAARRALVAACSPEGWPER